MLNKKNKLILAIGIFIFTSINGNARILVQARPLNQETAHLNGCNIEKLNEPCDLELLTRAEIETLVYAKLNEVKDSLNFESAKFNYTRTQGQDSINNSADNSRPIEIKSGLIDRFTSKINQSKLNILSRLKPIVNNIAKKDVEDLIAKYKREKNPEN